MSKANATENDTLDAILRGVDPSWRSNASRYLALYTSDPGKAPIGTALGTGAWQIKKIDKTVTDNVTITFAAAGAFTATWTNRGSETYS